MATAWQRWAWPLGKLILAAAILVAVGLQFYNDLRRPELAEITWRPGWLALSALLYLSFLATSGWCWRRLLAHFGAPLPVSVAVRAYFISQLGKYIPGKALALLMRGLMVRGPNLRLGLAILTAFYEVLTTMAAGAFVAAVVFIVQPSDALDLHIHPVLAGFLLLGLCAFPLLPAVFNRVAARMANKLATQEAGPPPRIDILTLAQGILGVSCGWCLLGVSVWCGLVAVLPEPPSLDVSIWLRCTGAIGLAYVGGFLAVFMPSGVGVREYFLLRLLGDAAPGALIAAAVLLMRVAWTAAELLLAGLLYPWRPGAPDSVQATSQTAPAD